MVLPSRDFLVQQSVLTVLHDRYPSSIRIYGRAAWGEKLIGLIHDDFMEGREFCARVGLEFNSRVRAARAAWRAA